MAADNWHLLAKRAEKMMLEGVGSGLPESAIAVPLHGERAFLRTFATRAQDCGALFMPRGRTNQHPRLPQRNRGADRSSTTRRRSDRRTVRLSANGLTVDKAAQLAELALLARESVRPEPGVVEPRRIHRCGERAASTLRPLCAEFNERKEDLGTIFTEGVLTLDLESLCQRFERMHHGLGKLRSTYRADKKAIAAIARLGKPSRDVISALPGPRVAAPHVAAEGCRVSPC